MPGSLVFGAAASDRVSSGNAADINDLTLFTYLFWVYATTRTAGRRISQKGRAAVAPNGYKYLSLLNTTGDLDATVGRATTDARFTTSASPLALNTWVCCAYSYDAADATQSVRIYAGQSGVAMTLQAGTSTLGAGATLGDNGDALIWGNNAGATLAVQGRLGPCALFGTNLSLADVESWRQVPRKTVGTAVALRFSRAGKDAADWIEYGSGGSNGTVTGATQGDGPPLVFPWVLDEDDEMAA